MGGLDIKHVAGVTMTQVLAASLVGAWSHGRRAMVHRPLAVIAGAAMATGALVGAVASHRLSSEALLLVFGAMATVALPLMLIAPQGADQPPVGDVRFSRVAAAGYPGAIGIASGLVGAGGAFLLVPVLIGVLGIPVRITIGTSLAITGISASMGFLGKLVTGQIPLWPAVAVVVGALAGAPVGARLSRRAPVPLLRLALALVIAVVAIGVWIDVLVR